MEPRTDLVTYCRIEVAAERVGLPVARVRRYVRTGLVPVPRYDHRVPLLGEAELARLRRIRRLTDDLGVHPSALDLVLRLLDEIEALRAGFPRETGR